MEPEDSESQYSFDYSQTSDEFTLSKSDQVSNGAEIDEVHGMSKTKNFRIKTGTQTKDLRLQSPSNRKFNAESSSKPQIDCAEKEFDSVIVSANKCIATFDMNAQSFLCALPSDDSFANLDRGKKLF